MKHRYYLTFALYTITIILGGCSLHKKKSCPPITTSQIPLTDRPAVREKKELRMVVFIHGATTFIPSLEAFRYAWQQRSKQNSPESFYQHYQNRIRFGGYRKKQAIGSKGFWPINGDAQPPSYIKRSIHTQEAFTIARLYKQVLKKVEGSHLITKLYTFGWDGSLSLECRKHSAHLLYRALDKHYTKLKEKFPDHEVSVSVLGHSHGGNVALHLAQWEEHYKKNMSIDTLTLLGTPIQSETKSYIHAPIFKKVLNIYSTNDWVQKLDCISTKDCFSSRTFRRRSKYQHTSQCNIPDKVTDLEVRIGNYRPMHAEFWFMGGIVHFFYRLKLPIYPFPLAIFTPCFAKIISQSKDHSHHLRLILDRIDQKSYRFYLFDKKTQKWLDTLFKAELPLIHVLPKQTQQHLEKRIKKGFCSF